MKISWKITHDGNRRVLKRENENIRVEKINNKRSRQSAKDDVRATSDPDSGCIANDNSSSFVKEHATKKSGSTITWKVVRECNRRVLQQQVFKRNRPSLNEWVADRLNNHKRVKSSSADDVEAIKQYFAGNAADEVCLKNKQIVVRAMRTNVYPKLPLVLPDDFTTLYIEHPVTKESVPIWKYVLAVLHACGFDTNV